MKLESIEKLIKIKDDEVIEMGVVYANYEEDNISISNCIVSEFEELIIQFQGDIITASITLMGIFNNEIKKDFENGEVNNLLKFVLAPSKDGFKVDVTSHYLDKHMIEIRDGNFRENIDNLLDFLNDLKENVTKSINDIINTHLELSEVGKIREYILLYENGRNISKSDFVRYTDRPISQQKAEIQELINSGLTTKLYDNVIENNPELIDKKFAIKFTLIDGTDVEDVQVGEF